MLGQRADVAPAQTLAQLWAGTGRDSRFYACDENPKDFNPYSAGIDFSRHNLTSTDVRFWRLKPIPAL